MIVHLFTYIIKETQSMLQIITITLNKESQYSHYTTDVPQRYIETVNSFVAFLLLYNQTTKKLTNM